MKIFKDFLHMSGGGYPELHENLRINIEYIKFDSDILYDPIKNSFEFTIIYLGLQFYPCHYKGQIIEILDDIQAFLLPHIAKDFGKNWELYLHDGNKFKTIHVKNLLRLELSEEHSHLFSYNKVILSKGMKYQFGQTPTHS